MTGCSDLGACTQLVIIEFYAETATSEVGFKFGLRLTLADCQRPAKTAKLKMTVKIC